jgi:hypothetical protein
MSYSLLARYQKTLYTPRHSNKQGVCWYPLSISCIR